MIGLVAIVVGGGAGCAVPTGPIDKTPEATGTPISSAAAASAIPPSAVTDVDSCEAFGDVSTILQNAMSGLYDERMSQQEYDGWLRLATRVLDRVPTRGEGAVSDAIAALKEAAPAIPIGAIGATSIGTSEWYVAAPLVEVCREAGSEIVTEGFTGG